MSSAAHRLLRCVLLCLGVVAGGVASPALADRGFTPRFSANDTGNVAIVGNTLETCPVATSGCPAAQSGSGASLNNNNWSMVRVDADSDPATTIDSSSATLTLPAAATVLFAGLYFGAATTAGTGGQAARVLLCGTR